MIPRALTLALVFTLVVAVPPGARAGEPTEQLRTEIDELYRTVKQAPAPPAAGRESTAVLDRMFDWGRMAEAALRGHWQQRTAVERTEFTSLFADLFRRAYVARVNLVDASRFQYLGDATDGTRGEVKTKVMTKRGSTLDVDYAVRRGDSGRWRVEDVRVEQLSLIENYRIQFHTIITRASYPALAAKLRERGAQAQ